jgi:hypothetical protein
MKRAKETRKVKDVKEVREARETGLKNPTDLNSQAADKTFFTKKGEVFSYIDNKKKALPFLYTLFYRCV